MAMKKSLSMSRLPVKTSTSTTPRSSSRKTAPFTPPLSSSSDLSETSSSYPSKLLHNAQVATTTLVRVLRNAGFSILVGWLFGYCYTTGNVASGKPPAEQSYESFVAANGAWFHIVYSCTMVVMYAVRLTFEKFVIHSKHHEPTSAEPTSRSLSLARCSCKLLWAMTPHLAFSTAAEVVGCYMLIKYMPPSGRKYKPAMYMNSFWSNFVVVSAEFCTRNICNNETVRGLARRQLRESAQQTAHGGNSKHRHARRRYSWRSSISRFLVIYLRALPGVVSSLIAIVYVHSISLFASIDHQSELMAFAVGNIALKLTLQEVAKRHLLSTKVPLPRRIMIVLVSTPTILVDTQVRMLLMRLQNVTISVLGSALLALAEISVRAFKSLMVHREVHHLLKKRIVPVFEKARRRGTDSETRNELQAKRRSTMPPRPSTDEMDARRQRHLVVHAAEIYADMYAEYMAMGCSYAIMLFFWDHPQYQFVSGAVNKPEATRRLHQFIIFSFQVGVEVIVDFLACNVEVLQGVDFGSFDQNDPFLTFFMAILAFANVSISAGLYIHS